MVKSSLFDQSRFFKIKINDITGAIDYSFFTMNHFVHQCIRGQGGYALKCTVAYSQRGRVKNFDILRK